MHHLYSASSRVSKLVLLTLAIFGATVFGDRLESPVWSQPPAAATGATNERVGHDPEKGLSRVVTPDNQILTPAGLQVPLQYGRPNAIALSPDGKILAVGAKSGQLTIVDPATGLVLQQVALPLLDLNASIPITENILKPDTKARISFTGLVFSPDGKRIYLSDVNGSIKVFSVNAEGVVAGVLSMTMPKANTPTRKEDIPCGLAVSADGSKLYVALNLSNRLVEVDTEKGAVLRTWDVGMAPYDVRLVRGKAYVSNWGGRRPDGKSPTAHAGRGMEVRVDPRTGAANEGSLSIIELKESGHVSELVTGRHASALAVSPDEKYLCIACATSDFIDVLDLSKDEFCGRIFPKQTPADLFGAAPTAMTFSPDGDDLYVCNGSQNAIAVIEFDHGKGELEGLIPTGWYPGAIAYDAGRKQLLVGNIKSVGMLKTKAADTETSGINVHGSLMGSLSLIPLPKTEEELKAHTSSVLRNYRAPLLQAAFAPPRPNQPARPLPERVGEPSVFKHVLYIIKENRTYDQVLGDMPEGKGDPALCIFGEKITPNQHKLAREFGLLDNTYCSGILSADGHNWACSSITTDYLERQMPAFPRSYPDGFAMKDSDALAWSPAGFIWDAARAKQKSIRIFGEFAEPIRKWKDPKRTGGPNWSEIWDDWRKHKGGPESEIVISAKPSLGTFRDDFCESFPTYDLNVPEALRADAFLKELAAWEKSGAMPNLMVMSLPNDHTAGRGAKFPTPRSYLAEHDLALGRIVEGVSRSRFWKETCIFIIEDDPQAGWDHVSGYRTTAFVISPYSRKRGTLSTQYNQTSVLRSMELILGLPPMNQLDATATPMFECFSDTIDPAPFVALENQWPLDDLNGKVTISDRRDATAGEDLAISATLPLEKLDACPEDVLNRLLWRSVHGDRVPFPAWAVQVVKDDD